ELWEIVQRRLAARVFESADGSTLSPFVFHREGQRLGDWRKTWKAACEAARVPGLLFHDFRWSAVRNLIRSGVPQAVAQEISGHRTRPMFDRYNVAPAAEAREAIRQPLQDFGPKRLRTATEQLRFESGRRRNE